MINDRQIQLRAATFFTTKIDGGRFSCINGVRRNYKGKFESRHQSLSADSFPQQKRWPGSARFSGYYAFTVKQRHPVMDESRGEARIICFEANPKTSAGSQWFTNIFYSGTSGVSPLNPTSFTCLIYSRLISPTNENSNRWNRLRAAAKSYNHDRLHQGIERPDIFRAQGSREPEAPGFYREN